MKKKKWLLPLLLVLCFSAPLAACKRVNDLDAPPPTAGIESSTQESASAPPTSSTPESSAPLPPTSSPESSLPSPPSEPVVKKAQYIKSTGSSVNIRAGAGTDFAVLGVAEKGTMYAVTGKTGSWYKTYYRGKTAYISTSYAAAFTLEKTESKMEKVIEEGYKLLGVPYVYGAVRLHDGSGRLLSGFSVQKFDCSSLMQYIFYKGAEKNLGVTTRTQVKQGKAVKRADLQRGDCIFFTNEERQYNTGVARVGHVALYLGDGYILHTASDYARIEKISAKRWSFYIEARRFV